MAFWAKAMFWATVGSVFLTLIGVILIWRTLVYSRNAAEAAKDMVLEARKTTFAARAAVREGKLATQAANRSADIQEDAFERLERPYLFIRIENINNLISPSKAIAPFVSYFIDNHGKTPAIFQSVIVDLLPFEEVSFSDCKPRLSMNATKYQWYEVIAPGKSTSHSRSLPLKGGSLGQASDKNKPLAIHGLITYQDAIGKLYMDHFVLLYDFHSDAFRLEYSRSHTEEPKTGNEAENA